MRVRKKENKIFERYTLGRSPHVGLGLILSFHLLIAYALLMTYLYKTVNDFSDLVAFGIIYGLFLLIILRAIFKGKTTKYVNNKFIKLKKGRKHDFLKHYFNDIQCRNNSNYYKSFSLVKHLKKQILKPFLWTAGLVLFPTVITLWSMYLTGVFISFLPIMFLLLPFNFVIIYIAFEHYSNIGNIIKKGNICILRNQIKSYYIHNNWIFFY